MPFVDVKVKECIEHVSDKEEEEEEGVEDDKGSYKASIHGTTMTTSNITIFINWRLWKVSNWMQMV